MTRNDLLKYKNLLGFNLGQIEKDYLQHIFLHRIYRLVSNELVFKGGTCLQKTFGLNRFSEDLDFTLNGKCRLKNVMEDAAGAITLFGYESEVAKEKKDEISNSFLLRIRGPLYDGSDKSIVTLRAEISIREKVIQEVENRSIIPVYNDLPPYTLLTMKFEEILAEKVRAVITRTRAKDVYDLWFLLKKNIPADIRLINEKLKYYNLSFDKKTFTKSIEGMGKIWEKELRAILPIIPDFNNAKKEILNTFQ